MSASLFAPIESARAQLGLGTLSGRVTDASTDKPVEDAVVTAVSPALQGEQTVVTDGTGLFRIPNLPPGTYQIRYEGDTFRPYARDGIELRAGITLRVYAQLQPEMLKAEEVTIIAAPPTIDVGTARSGVSLNEDFTSRIALAPPGGKGGGARSFEQLAEVAPTARNDQYGASIAGTSSPENQFMLDGLSVGDPGYGFNSVPLSIDFIKEANIITGGYLPEYGRGGGGVLDVVTKGGSNEFRATVFTNVTPWQAKPRYLQAQDTISTTARLRSTADLGFDLGGPLIKDKLWFYIGADISKQQFSLIRNLNVLSVDEEGAYLRDSQGLIVSERIPGTERNFLAESRSLQYIGKLTWSPTENDRIELSHRGTPSASGGNGNYSVDYSTGRPSPNPYNGESILGNYGASSYRQGMAAYDTSVKWTHSALNKRLTFDTILGWHNQRTYDLASDGTALDSNDGLSGTNPFRYQFSGPLASITDYETLPDPSVCANPVAMGAVRCPAQRYTIGGPGLLQDRSYDRYQARELVTFVAEALGHHIIKAGIDFEYMNLRSAKKHPGNVYYFGTRDGVDDYRRYGGLTGPDQAYDTEPLKYKTSSLAVGAFLQDSWSIADVITVNAGFRYDTQMLYTNDKLGLALPNQWSPRIGVIYDPTQSGRAKLFANYAIYYQSIPLNIMDRAGSGEPQIGSSRDLASCDPTSSNYPESCQASGNLSQVGGPASPDRNFYYATVGKIAVDPDIKPPSSSELSLGGEYEIIPQGRLGLTYIRRWTNSIIEDMSRDSLGNVFFLGNPGRGIASDFPEASRTYDAGIVSFTKTFGNAWLAQASYTLAYLRGNWEGMFRSQTGQLDPGSNADFDLRSLTVNRTGALDGDRRHEIKIFVARDFALAPQHHINVGLGYRSSSGAPNNYLGRHFRYGNDEVFILPRGAGIRSPWVHNIDLHLGYMFYESKTSTLSVTADIFNLFNFRAATRLSNRYTLTNVQPNTTDDPTDVIVGDDKKNLRPSAVSTQSGVPFTDAQKYLGYGAPVAYQEPLTIRFGVKGTF